MGRNLRQVTNAPMHHHRVHNFSVSIHGLRARLLRWDMSVLIAQASFGLREKHKVLCGFLWRFAHGSTVGRASSGEERLSASSGAEVKDEVRAEYEAQCALLEKTVALHYEAGRICAEDGRLERCLVSRPVATNFSMRQGAMRGYWAVVGGRVVFLQDTWRQYVLEPEGRILRELEAHRAVLGHGELRADDSEQGGPTTTVLPVHRVALIPRGRLIGFPLQTLQGTKELLNAAHDAFQALIAAHDKARRIHRDISAGNIMLYRKPSQDHRTGYLIDWELSSKVQEDGQATDKYIVRLEARSQRRHMLQDDMEALLYVVAYCGLHWLQHPAHSRDTRLVVQALFHNGREVRAGDVPGVTHMTFQMMEPGKGKLAIKENQTYVDGANFNADLKDWLSRSMDLNHPRDVNAATQWDMPEPWNDYWTEFLGRQLPEDDRIRKQDSSSMRPKSAVKAISHRAGIHPNKRKGPQCRGRTEDGRTNGVLGNGRPVKRLKRAAG
ncbi:predicted protein [Sparassis crispa]|uniref:Fungal-type protein kinase domain-containing protein n=1 Tax=Sparassis crispa TaxID=139825 RepID=A0A401GV66_9APHY|nr:predicted protein [Sparassis crispa]GBE86115.1 predicted protein [Sparassis crispa]